MYGFRCSKEAIRMKVYAIAGLYTTESYLCCKRYLPTWREFGPYKLFAFCKGCGVKLDTRRELQ